jgi:hypothetical protein
MNWKQNVIELVRTSVVAIIFATSLVLNIRKDISEIKTAVELHVQDKVSHLSDSRRAELDYMVTRGPIFDDKQKARLDLVYEKLTRVELQLTYMERQIVDLIKTMNHPQ